MALAGVENLTLFFLLVMARLPAFMGRPDKPGDDVI
jgi:hypothetical protein